MWILAIISLVDNVLNYQAYDGNGELGFDSGERAREMAVSSKECSRRENYPMKKFWDSDKK